MISQIAVIHGLVIISGILAIALLVWSVYTAPTPEGKVEAMKKWLELVKVLAPVILSVTPGVPPILIPAIVHSIETAEQIPGATGAQKKAAVLDEVRTGLAVTAAVKGAPVIDTELTVAAVSSGIDAAVNGVNAVHSIHNTK